MICTMFGSITFFRSAHRGGLVTSFNFFSFTLFTGLFSNVNTKIKSYMRMVRVGWERWTNIWFCIHNTTTHHMSCWQNTSIFNIYNSIYTHISDRFIHYLNTLLHTKKIHSGYLHGSDGLYVGSPIYVSSAAAWKIKGYLHGSDGLYVVSYIRL